MYFYILFIFIQSQGFELFIEKDKQYLIANDNKTDIRFQDETLEQSQCHPSKQYLENSNEKHTKFIFNNNHQEDQITVVMHPLVYDTDVLNILYSPKKKPYEIEPNSSEQFIISYECKATKDQISWSLIVLEFQVFFNQNHSQYYAIYFYKQCLQTELQIHPLIILLILAVTLIIIGTNYGLQEIKMLEQIKTDEFNAKTSVLFILSASVLLFCLFKFPQIGQLVLSVVIFFLAIMSIQIIIEDQLQKMIGNNTLLKIVSYLISFGIVFSYFYYKHWIINNIVAFLITLLMFKIIEIDSFKTATLLLSLAFFYDIFWVFISPYFFGTSVMAQVATSIDLPMKFICPPLMISNTSPLMRCSILGLGDILLPGIVIKYVLKFENLLNKGYCMYITSIIGYCIGLIVCMCSLVIYQQAQPALLYLVPIILIPVIIMSVIRKQFYQLWKGQVFKSQKQAGVYELQQSEQV
ncbi:unnamed protein product (macronuclear) [Paramecium tetraurelia]|uniref:Signal peptide peptidase n=1 Tax=Paramecium tetraurelia TaxID=5888 RepID=A0D7C2_PARTE|nr:uncharacterized protein GSPATT00001981001 [Paramecium tetraurelia]CAK78939.1 unnamed protein product [Paramecium tetraurelia]|eukprot:XP_001446336.1 hypothetical protein (macronuclear) [Paramecium tetraurelia strain d4-2]